MSKIRVGEATNTDYEILPEGSYEIYVEGYDDIEVDGDITKSTMVLVVRDDLDQDFARRKVWVRVSDNPNIAWKINNIASACGIPSGTEFEDLKDFLDETKGKSMKIYVKHRTYNGKNYVDVRGFYPSREAAYVSEDALDDELVL